MRVNELIIKQFEWSIIWTIFLLTILLIPTTNAVPAIPKVETLSQSDGTQFEVIRFGDENGVVYKTVYGEEVEKDSQNTWRYKNDKIKIESEQIKYHQLSQKNYAISSAEKNVDDEQAQYGMRRASGKDEDKPKRDPVTGTQKILVLMVQFGENRSSWIPVMTDSFDENVNLTLTVDLTGYSEASLNYETTYGFVYSSENYGRVMISNNNGTNWTYLSGSNMSSGSPKGYRGYLVNWTKETINISAYSGSVVMIRFQCYDCLESWSQAWYIDDINITGNGTTLFYDNCDTANQSWNNRSWKIYNGSTSQTKFTSAHTQYYYENKLFNRSYSSSMWSYYNQTSYGQISINGTVTAVLTAKRPYSYYGDGYGFNGGINGLIEEASIIADSQVDFSDYDFDSDGYVNHLLILHAGNTGEEGGGSSTIWSHKSSVWPFLPRDGVYLAMYYTVGESSPLGTNAHEFGHSIGMPDTYDTSYVTYGAGSWDLMGYGSWNGGGATPAHPSAYCKTVVGWVNIINITTTSINVTVQQAVTNNTIYALLNVTDSEYFLVENRQKTGFDASIPGSGILIWHKYGSRPRLEEADGDYALERKTNQGASTDPWSNNMRGFANYTTPNSTYYGGTYTGVKITNIGASGSVMTFDAYDELAPTITFSATNPVNNSNITGTTTTINISSNEPLYNAILEWQGENISMSNSSKKDWYYTKTAITEGTYTYRVIGNDSAFNLGTSETRTISFNDTIIIIAINSPLNMTIDDDGNITLNFTATETESQIRNCTLWHNITGTWSLNQTNTTAITSGSPYQFNLTEISDKTFIWNIQCTDTAGNQAWNNTNWTIRVDKTWPNVTLISPANNSYDNDGTIYFNFTVTDTAIANCSLWTNITGTWSENQTNRTAITTGTQYQFNITGIPNSVQIIWNIKCFDQIGRSNFSQNNWTSTIDTIAPKVSINSPPNETIDDDGNITLNFTATETESQIRNCTLWHNITGTWAKNQTNRTTITSGNWSHFNLTNLNDQIFIWNIRCTDTAGNQGWNNTNWTITVDKTWPNVTLNSPTNDSSDIDGTIYFNFTVTDTAIANCSLWTNITDNWIKNQTNTTTITSGTQYQFIIINLPEGGYIWNVQCTDKIGRSAYNLQNWTITVLNNTWDTDNDNYNNTNSGGNDCNDTNSSINPGATEICGNSIDDDCDGEIDEGCGGDDAPSGGGGGGGGGSGGGAAINRSNEQTFMLNNLIQEEPRTLTITKDEIAIRKIKIEFNKTAKNAKITIRKETNKTEEITNEIIYQTYTIELTGKEATIKEAEITFRIPVTWFESEGTNKNTVVLYHKTTLGWEELKTEEQGTEGAYYMYKARTASFSLFTITAEKQEKTTTSTTTVTTQKTTTTQITSTTTLQEIQENENTQIMQEKPQNIEEKPKGNLKVLAAMAIGIMIILAIIITTTRKRKKPTKATQEHNKELKEYIKQAKQAGMTKEEIKKELEKTGWPKKMINEILKK